MARLNRESPYPEISEIPAWVRDIPTRSIGNFSVKLINIFGREYLMGVKRGPSPARTSGTNLGIFITGKAY
jgi:hypothetical protein